LLRLKGYEVEKVREEEMGIIVEIRVAHQRKPNRTPVKPGKTS